MDWTILWWILAVLIIIAGLIGTVVPAIPGIPMMFAGIALMHGIVGIMGLSAHWLGLFYMSLMFIGHLVYLPLIVTALVDVVMDFRGRLRKSKAD